MNCEDLQVQVTEKEVFCDWNIEDDLRWCAGIRSWRISDGDRRRGRCRSRFKIQFSRQCVQ